MLRQGPQGLDEDDEEAEESRLELTFDALDADIHLDNSVRSNPRLNAHNGHASSAGMTDISEGPKTQKTIDRWSASTGKPATMTLKEQEKVIDELKKESFSLKLKVYFLEDRLAKMSPEHVDQALNENIEMKVKLQKMHSELKQYKRLLVEAHAAIEALQAQKNCDLQHGMTEEQEEDYRNAITETLNLQETLKQLSGRISALEEEAKIKDLELEDLHARLGELDTQANTIEDLRDLTGKYEAQIAELEDRLAEYEQNTSRMMEKSRADEGWEARCRELDKDLGASMEHRSDLENELALTRRENAELNHQLELHRDELSKARIDSAELSHQLEEEREQMRQVQDMHANDMRTLSERWTLDRQQLREQLSDMDVDMEELRKANEQLEAQAQDLLAWRNEDAARHDQELEDKAVEFDQLRKELGRMDDVLQDKDTKIAELQDKIDLLELMRRDNDAVHEEVIASLRSKMQAELAANPDASSVPLHDFQQMSEELALKDKQNRILESQLRMEIDQRIAIESSTRDRESNGLDRWRDEREQLERNYEDLVHDLQGKLTTASEQIRELGNELDERDSQLRYYKEQLNLASKQSKEVEERYEEMELRLNSDLEATTAELFDIRQEFEQIRASRVENSDLLQSRSNEMDRLNVKARRLTDNLAALESQKEQLELSLRDRNAAVGLLKSRLHELELEISKNQRDEDTSGETSKSDLVERNSLLLTVLQHLESILGGDSRLDSNMLPKPSANFAYFSKHLISRLKSLSRLFILFEKKGKELEDKACGQFIILKKQLDLKLKQMDRFETIVRNAADRQRKWREQLVYKQRENEELQVKLQLFARTIAELKARSGSSERAQDYEVRYKQAERKLQLEKSRAVDAEERWNARLRELERRTKEAEERVLRERQGAKEKLAALQDVNMSAQKTIENLQRKNDQLMRP
ncbi:hypothetical protein BGZ70_001306 [Mortierella alpina]|uniref:Centrosomin N-terminal motif 1 domain-containing protein n=1 Tax=Mortierella alpina TaxID=64518 RepID=A0A9P6IW49_MORAP|nr:hypothetical protein BGZ70_001306 [Mortierella alpina]